MKTRVIAMIFAICMIAASLSSCVVVKIGEEDKLTGEVAFDANTVISEKWDSDLIPDLEERKTDLAELINSAKGDFKTVSDKGKYSMGASGELNFVVSGKATIKEIDRSSKAGRMVLTLDGYKGDMTIVIQIGSVYKGTSVRDSLTFISYENYTNQVEWAQISQSINSKIDKEVIGSLDLEKSVGKTVEFLGCFTANSDEEVLITPVTMAVS